MPDNVALDLTHIPRRSPRGGGVDDLNLLGISRPANSAVFTVYLAARGKLTAEIRAP